MRGAEQKSTEEQNHQINPDVGNLLDELPAGSRLFATPQAIGEIAKQEANPSDENPWYDYYNDIQAYEATFRDVLGETHIADHLQERKNQGKSAVVLDLMGPGFVLRGLSYDAALAVTLCDRRVQEQKDIDAQNNLTVITGDVRKSWEEVKTWLTEHELAGFDVVLCRPMKGYDTLPRNNDTYYSLLQSIWEVLTRDEGLFLFEIPRYKHGVLANWARKSSGLVDVKGTFKNDLLLVKGPKAPDVLPKL